MHLLLFAVGTVRCAVPAASVVEVIRAVRLLPAVGIEGLAGVVDVHGDLLPVLDLRALLDQPPRPLHPDEHFVIVDTGDGRLVLRTDQAIEVSARAPDPDVRVLSDPGMLLPAATREWLTRAGSHLDTAGGVS